MTAWDFLDKHWGLGMEVFLLLMTGALSNLFWRFAKSVSDAYLETRAKYLKR